MKRIPLVIGLAAVVIGAAAWVYQLIGGLAVTNMSNLFSWGFYIGCFVFLVGVAAGGMIISSSIYLFDVKRLKPFGKIASLSAFACILAAGCMVIVDLGRVQNIGQMLVHPNFTSPLVWDIVVITLYLILTFLSVYFQLLPDCKRSGKRFLNGWIAKRTEDEVDAISARWSRIVALVALPVAVLIHTVTALIFATQNGHPWWHTAMLPADFIAMAVASGGALVLIIALAVAGRSRWNEYAGGFATIARIAAVALAVHFFFVAVELVLLAWTGGGESAALLEALTGTYGLLYLLEIVLTAGAMVLFFTKAGSRQPALLVAGGIAVLAGTLVHRLMLLYPEFATSGFSIVTSMGVGWLYPLSTGRYLITGQAFASTYAYAPNAIEVGVTLLPFGLLLVVLALVANRYRMIGSEPASQASAPDQ